MNIFEKLGLLAVLIATARSIEYIIIGEGDIVIRAEILKSPAWETIIVFVCGSLLFLFAGGWFKK